MEKVRRTSVVAATLLFLAGGCRCDEEQAPPSPAASVPAPLVSVPSATAPAPLPSSAPLRLPRHCPKEMVLVDNALCVDRYETSLEDSSTGRALSPYYPVLASYGEQYPPTAATAVPASTETSTDSEGTADSYAMPELPEWQRQGVAKAIARSRAGVIPNGHLEESVINAACQAAGKRLCTLAEWKRACRGEADTKFPYGTDYTAKKCNVFREEHPGRVLYGNFSRGMQDPRMGLVRGARGPLLRKTGETESCASHWGNDAIYDMVGNLDEWVEDPEGTFVGGFFSRATKEGCEQVVTTHPAAYRDYSLGGRCCKDAAEGAPQR